MRQFDRAFANKEIIGQEKTELRRRNSKAFDLGGGKTRLLQSPGMVHYEKPDGTLDDIDIEPRETRQAWIIDRAPYVLTVQKKGGLATYEGRVTKLSVTLRNDGETPEFDGTEWRWAIGERVAVLRPTPTGIAIETILLTEAAEPSDAWSYDGMEPGTLKGTDAGGDPVEVVDGRFTGRVSRLKDKSTRQREWRASPEYPVRLR